MQKTKINKKIFVTIAVLAMVFSSLVILSGANATGTNFSVTFSESNLPIGAVWYVNVTGVAASGPIQVTATTGHNATFLLNNGTYSYTIAAGNHAYKPTPSSGSFTGAGVNLAEAISFSMITYSVSFNETGLTASTTWDVIFNNLNQTSTTKYDNFTYQINGTYDFTVSATNYTASPSSGTLTINGKAVSEAITFTPTKRYSYLFSSVGLLANSTFTVTMVSSSRIYASQITREGSDANVSGLINGTYTLSVIASPPPGIARNYAAVIWNGSPATVTVAGAQASAQALGFEREYQVAFSESGLPSGTQWSVNFNSAVISASTSSVSVNALNGTFTYTIGSVSGYLPNPGSGTVTVAGKNSTNGIVFSESGVTYSVRFIETGLPASTSWSMMLGPFSGTSTTNTTTFSVVNGTYNWYNITNANAHYYSSTPSGTLTVAGKSIKENVTFHYGYLVTFVPRNLTKWVPWTVTYNGTSNSSAKGTNITFMLKNGSGYKFSISAPANWGVSPSTGYVNISGAAEIFKLNFTKLFYKIEFTEVGLPAGIVFGVTVNNILYQSANGTIIIPEHNGTLTYAPEVISGYTVTPSAGTINVNFSSITTQIRYTAASVNTGGGQLGSGWTLQALEHWMLLNYVYAAIGMVAILGIAGFSTIEHRRGWKKGVRERKRKTKKNFK
jgi:hypothetical protein